MKLLFDQNLSHRLVQTLAADYPGSEHVRNVGLRAADDSLVWQYAQEHNFLLVSKDADFHHRSLIFGYPPKVVWIKLGNCSTQTIETLLRNRRRDVARFEADATASFLILS